MKDMSIDFRKAKIFISNLMEDSLVEDVIEINEISPSSLNEIQGLKLSLEISNDVLSNPQHYLVNYIKTKITKDHELYDFLDPDNVEVLLNSQRLTSEGVNTEVLIGNKNLGWSISFGGLMVEAYVSSFSESSFVFNEPKESMEKRISSYASDEAVNFIGDFEEQIRFLMAGLNDNIKGEIYDKISKHLYNSKILSPALSLVSKHDLESEINNQDNPTSISKKSKIKKM